MTPCDCPECLDKETKNCFLEEPCGTCWACFINDEESKDSDFDADFGHGRS